MKVFTRRRAVLAIIGASAIAVLGMAGCSRFDRSAGPPTEAVAQTTDLAWPAQALESIGLDTADLATPDLATPDLAAANPAADLAPAADVSPDPANTRKENRRKHRLVRYAFGHNALHGEAVVSTDEGTKTVVAQRGTVTAIDTTSVTVKSADGFTLTWTFGTPITVVEKRNPVQPSAIAVGSTVGVAGEKSGTATTARLIVVPRKTA